jgi:hypothetical protein
MPAKSSVDALDALAQAVEHLIAAIERSKRHESIAFWGEIDHARSCLAEARLDIRAANTTARATGQVLPVVPVATGCKGDSENTCSPGGSIRGRVLGGDAAA